MIETDVRPVVFDGRPYYARSPFQVGLLSFCTLGIYVFWWSFYTRRSAAALLEQPENAFWMSAALLVPLFNLWVFYDLLEKVKVLGLRARLHISGGLLVAGLAWLALAVCSRLPAPAYALSLLSFLCLAYLQTFVTRAEFVLSDRTITPKAFGWVEILVIVIGGAFKVFVFAGMLIDPNARGLHLSPYWPFVAIVEALAIAGLVVTYLKSRSLQLAETV